jgi:hypothetical protein
MMAPQKSLFLAGMLLLAGCCPPESDTEKPGLRMISPGFEGVVSTSSAGTIKLAFDASDNFQLYDVRVHLFNSLGEVIYSDIHAIPDRSFFHYEKDVFPGEETELRLQVVATDNNANSSVTTTDFTLAPRSGDPLFAE